MIIISAKSDIIYQTQKGQCVILLVVLNLWGIMKKFHLLLAVALCEDSRCTWADD